MPKCLCLTWSFRKTRQCACEKLIILFGVRFEGNSRMLFTKYLRAWQRGRTEGVVLNVCLNNEKWLLLASADVARRAALDSWFIDELFVFRHYWLHNLHSLSESLSFVLGYVKESTTINAATATTGAAAHRAGSRRNANVQLSRNT